MVADQHELRVRCLDVIEQLGELPRRDHPGLVDHDDATCRQRSGAAQVASSAATLVLAIPAPCCSSSRRAARDRRAHHRMTAVLPRVRATPSANVFPVRPPDHDRDAIAPRHRRSTIARCSPDSDGRARVARATSSGRLGPGCETGSNGAIDEPLLDAEQLDVEYVCSSRSTGNTRPSRRRNTSPSSALVPRTAARPASEARTAAAASSVARRSHAPGGSSSHNRLDHVPARERRPAPRQPVGERAARSLAAAARVVRREPQPDRRSLTEPNPSAAARSRHSHASSSTVAPDPSPARRQRRRLSSSGASRAALGQRALDLARRRLNARMTTSARRRAPRSPLARASTRRRARA